MRFLAFFVALGCWAQSIPFPGPGMAHSSGALTWTLINHGSNASTSGTATVPSTSCTGADFIAVGVSDFADATAGTVTDSSGNTYSHTTNAHTTGDPNYAIWYVQAPTVTGSMTFSYTGAFPSIFMQCWSGSKASPLDQQSNGTSGSGQPGSITPTLDGELVISGTYTESAGGSTIDGCYSANVTDNIGQGSSVGGAMAYCVQTTATATNPTWSSGSAVVIATIASFKVGP